MMGIFHLALLVCQRANSTATTVPTSNNNFQTANNQQLENNQQLHNNQHQQQQQQQQQQQTYPWNIRNVDASCQGKMVIFSMVIS